MKTMKIQSFKCCIKRLIKIMKVAKIAKISKTANASTAIASISLVALLFFAQTLSFGYVNFGVGYTFDMSNAPVNSSLVRIGYEEKGFLLNADYFVNTSWNINGAFLFETFSNVAVGPMVNITNNFSNSSMKFTLGPSLLLNFTNFELLAGYLMDFNAASQFENIAESFYFQARFYVPAPPNMKMRDKLYLEIRYLPVKVSVLIGLLEPF